MTSMSRPREDRQCSAGLVSAQLEFPSVSDDGLGIYWVPIFVTLISFVVVHDKFVNGRR